MSVGIRLSLSGTHFRVSSRVDQMTCWTPACLRRLAPWPWPPHLLLGRKVLPEERDAIGAVGAPERLFQALLVLDVRRDDLGAQSAKFFRLVGPGVSRECARRESAAPVLQNGAARPPPCAPVAPTTAMILFSSTASLLGLSPTVFLFPGCLGTVWKYRSPQVIDDNFPCTVPTTG